MNGKQVKRKPTKRKPTKRTGSPTNAKPRAVQSQRAAEPVGELAPDDRVSGHHGADTHRRGRSGAGRIAIVLLVIAVVVACGAGAWMWHTNEERMRLERENAPVPIDVNGISEGRLERILSAMTLEQKVAQLFVVRPESLVDVGTVVEAGDSTRKAIEKRPVGGICYFSENLEDPEQTSEMLRNSSNFAKDSCGLPLFLCVDEEGGTVARVAQDEDFEVEDVGNMKDIGATGKTNEARDAARYVGGYLKELGFNVDFAPVADIVTSEDSPMYKRAFGDTPELVSEMVKAQVEGYERSGVLCSAKHFPGIGAAEEDSHDQSIYSSKTAEEMRSWELVPFAAAIDAHVPMVMVGHLTCTGITPEREEGEGDDKKTIPTPPATYDGNVINVLLRHTMGYQGIVVTDSLEMGAVADYCSPGEQAVLAVEAGADLVLLPKDFDKAYDGLLEAVKSGRISEDRINESVRRITAEKLRMIA